MSVNYLNEIEPELRRKLETLRDVPFRKPATAARSRARYMAQVRSLQVTQLNSGLPAFWPFVSWQRTFGFQPRFVQNRPRLSPARAFATILLILGFMFGSTAATVYASQSSLPADSLYPVKLLAEDVLLGVLTGNETKFNLALEYTNRRIDEITALQAQGIPVEGPVLTRLETQYQLALMLASGMPDDLMTQSLLQIRTTTRTQLLTMTTLRASAPEDTEAKLERVQQMLEEQEYMAQNGLEDPRTFREAMRNEFRNGSVIGTPENQLGTGTGTGPGPMDPPSELQPQSQSGNGEGGQQPALVPGGAPGVDETPSASIQGNASGKIQLPIHYGSPELLPGDMLNPFAVQGVGSASATAPTYSNGKKRMH